MPGVQLVQPCCALSPRSTDRVGGTRCDHPPKGRGLNERVTSEPVSWTTRFFGSGLVLVLRLSTASLLALMASGLLLAAFGRLEATLLAIVGVPLFVLLIRVGHLFERPVNRLASRDSWIAALTVALVLGSGAANAALSGEHLYVDRDPAVYLVTGAWLARNGSLEIATHAKANPLADVNGTGYASPGFYAPPPSDVIYAQFMHAFPVVLAVAEWVGGLWLMLKVNAIVATLSLLWFQVLARRFLQGEFWVALATLTLTFLAPQVFVSRDLYSEMLLQVFVLSFLYEMAPTPERLKTGRAFYGGLLLGATLMIRIDGLLVMIAVALFALAAQMRHTWSRDPLYQPCRGYLRAWGCLLLGAVLTGTIGLIDIALFSRPYLTAHLPEVVALVAVLLTAVVGFGLVRLVEPSQLLREFVRDRGSALQYVPGAVTVLLAGSAYFVRPLISVDMNDTELGPVRLAQLHEGLALEPSRLYSEYSLHWLGWYVGVPLLVLGVVGVARHAMGAFDGKARMSSLPVSLLLTVGLPYLWRPRITPDHLWAMRRFVPVVLPLWVLVGVIQADELVSRLKRRWVRHGAAFATSCAVILPPVFVLVPVATATTHVGFGGAIDRICSALPPDAWVVTSGGSSALGMSQTIRSFCGNPVFSIAGPITAEDLQARAGSGEVPIYVVSDGLFAPGCGWGAEEDRVSFDYRIPERTVMRPPAGSELVSFGVSIRPLQASQGRDPSVQAWNGIVLEEGGFIALDDVNPTPAGDAAIVVGIRLSTRWTPTEGSAVIIADGGYFGDWWMEYRVDGSVEGYVQTSGGLGVVRVPPGAIDDGRFHDLSLVVSQDRVGLYCDGSLMDLANLPGVPRDTETTGLVLGFGGGDGYGSQYMQAYIDEVWVAGLERWDPPQYGQAELSILDRWAFDAFERGTSPNSGPGDGPARLNDVGIFVSGP